MSGFRKFRTTLHRRRRSIEAAELGHLITGHAPDPARRTDAASPSLGDARGALETETTPLDFSPSVEAREIGPSPIAGWVRPKRPGTDN